MRFEGLQSSRRKSLLAHFLLTFKVCQGLLAHFLAHFSRCRLSLSAFRLPLLRPLPVLECAKRSRQPGGRRPLPRLRARWGGVLGVKAGCPTLARWRRFPPGVQTTEADSGAQLLLPRGFPSGSLHARPRRRSLCGSRHGSRPPPALTTRCRRPHCSATYAVVPLPHVGSSTRSPGSLVIIRQRSMTVVEVWTT